MPDSHCMNSTITEVETRIRYVTFKTEVSRSDNSTPITDRSNKTSRHSYPYTTVKSPRSRKAL